MSFPAAYAFGTIAAGSTDATFTLGDGSAGALVAVTGYQIRVLAVFALAGSSGANLTFNSKGAGAGTAITPAFPNGGNAGFVLNENTAGWFATNSGETLTVTTGAGSTTALLIVYKLIPV
jgi:hypothetical protein